MEEAKAIELQHTELNQSKADQAEARSISNISIYVFSHQYMLGSNFYLTKVIFSLILESEMLEVTRKILRI